MAYDIYMSIIPYMYLSTTNYHLYSKKGQLIINKKQ